MGTYKNKAYPLRINEELMNKITKIAEDEHRTRNKQIEYILESFVNEYEAKQAKERERETLKGKLSESKIG